MSRMSMKLRKKIGPDPNAVEIAVSPSDIARTRKEKVFLRDLFAHQQNSAIKEIVDLRANRRTFHRRTPKSVQDIDNNVKEKE